MLDDHLVPNAAVLLTESSDVYATNSSPTTELVVVAHSTTAGQPVKYMRVDASVIEGGQCNYYALVTPPS